MSTLLVTVSLPPKALSPNARPHWAAKAAAVKKHKAEAAMFARHAIRRQLEPLPVRGFLIVKPTFYYRVTRNRDRDNLQASLKAALDGIASALDIDDSRFLVEVASIEIDKDDPRVEIEIRAAN